MGSSRVFCVEYRVQRDLVLSRGPDQQCPTSPNGGVWEASRVRNNPKRVEVVKATFLCVQWTPEHSLAYLDRNVRVIE